MNPESSGLLRSDGTGEAKKVAKSFIRAISSIHKIRKRDLDHWEPQRKLVKKVNSIFCDCWVEWFKATLPKLYCAITYSRGTNLTTVVGVKLLISVMANERGKR